MSAAEAARVCSVADCDGPVLARDWCSKHYHQWHEQFRVYPPRDLSKRRWRQMVGRCTDPEHHAWDNYGGRGIKVCPEWLDFENYYRDTGDRPAGKSLDRIDNDGDYEPSNVRWATPAEQRANRRRDPMLDKTHCPRGHPYSGDNLYVTPSGQRVCRTCRDASSQRSRAQKLLASIEQGSQEGATA